MNKRLNVLVVDDEPDVVEIVSYNLIKNDYHVIRAYNGAEALSALTLYHPDLIIADIRMPIMNGIEMCREIRKNKNYDHIPVLFLSADTDDLTTISAFEAGGNHYISKPVRPSLLMSMIREIS